MRGVKFLFEGWRKASIFKHIFSLLFTVGTALMPFLNHEKLGSDDYLFPKLFIFVPAIYLMTITIAFGFRDLSAKLVRSFPFAKQLYTKSVPLFTIILTLGTVLPIVTAYFIFLKTIGAETVQFSDTLIIGAVICFLLLLTTPIFATAKAGVIFSYCSVFIPIVILVELFGTKFKNGFGVPLTTAVLIFAATIVFGIVWAFIISSVKYKKFR